MDYPHIDPDLPEEDYHARPEYGSTDLRAALKSLNHLRHKRAETVEQTSPMKLGTAIHCAVLEPDKFEELYLGSQPPIDPSDLYYRKRHTAELLAAGLTVPEIADELDVKEETVEGYVEEDEVQALRVYYVNHPPGSTPELSDAELDKVRRIRDRVRAHPEARLILDDGQPEVSLFGEIFEVPCKGRLDWDAPGYVWDLKTTSKDASLSSVRKLVAWRDYHVQAALYRELKAQTDEGVLPDFGWIFVETKPPHNVGVYKASSELIQEGRELVAQALDRIREYEADGRCFGGYCETLEILDLPGWAYRATTAESGVEEVEEAVPEVPF